MIKLEGVGKVYKRRWWGSFSGNHSSQPALKAVTLHVERGEVFALLGANGSGKSTLIRIIASLLHHDEGSVIVDGIRFPSSSFELRRKITRVSADAAFHKKLTGYENLIHSAYLYGYGRPHADARICSLCERFRFDPAMLSKTVDALSRGMQQKVSILRAMLPKPALLLLDEPTTGLDPLSRSDLHSALLTLWKEENTTVVLTSHDMEEVGTLAQRIGVLDKGMLIATGTEHRMRKLFNASTLVDVFRSASISKS